LAIEGRRYLARERFGGVKERFRRAKVQWTFERLNAKRWDGGAGRREAPKIFNKEYYFDDNGTIGGLLPPSPVGFGGLKAGAPEG